MPPQVLHGGLLHGYRALLHKLSGKGVLEGGGGAAGASVESKKSGSGGGRPSPMVVVDPFRAFWRLRAMVAEAKDEGKRKAKEQLTRALEKGRHLGKKVGVTMKQQQQQRLAPEMEEIMGSSGVMRSMAMLTVGVLCRTVMQGLNSTEIVGRDIMKNALSRPRGQPLITVSNHVASLDDPLLLAPIVPFWDLMKPGKLRWTLCATDRCFTNSLYTAFFRTTQVLPVQRGAGLHQLGMKAAEYRLSKGEWVHIFPEGTRSRDGQLGPPRPGIGRLVAACDRPPLIVPFVHTGMDKVLPVGSGVPRVGNKVRILIGDPIHVEDLLAASERHHWTERELYSALSNRVGQHLAVLWSQLEDKPIPEWAATPSSVNNENLAEFNTAHRWHERCVKGHWTTQPMLGNFALLGLTGVSYMSEWLQGSPVLWHSSGVYDRISNFLNYIKCRQEAVMVMLET